MKIRKKWHAEIQKLRQESDFAALAAKKKEEFIQFLNRGKNARYVALLMAAAVLLAGIQAGKGMTSSQKYLIRKDGTVSALIRNDRKQRAEFPLSVEASRDGKSIQKDVTVILGEDGTAKIREHRDPKKELKQAVQNAVRNAETAGTEKVTLPAELADGTRMRWEKKGEYKFILVLLMGPLLVSGLYVQDRNKQKRAEKEKEASVLCALPSFNDQLIMLLNCGMVFSDAFLMIAEGYRRQEQKSRFSQLILNVQERSEEYHQSLIRTLAEIAREEKIEEFSRFAETVSDSQLRGTDMLDSLEKERDVLWETRKNTAIKKGKLAETRLAFPLALLLLVLIVITAAPAVLQVR